MDNAELRHLFKVAVGTGHPSRHALMSSTEHFDTTLHPQFDLMEFSDPANDYDSGYTGNPYRGEHLTIPCISEEGGLFTIEVSFHKGTTLVDLVRFDGADSKAVATVADLIWDADEEEGAEGSDPWEPVVTPPRVQSKVKLTDSVPASFPDRFEERSIHEVLALAGNVAAQVRALREAICGLRPRLDLRRTAYELRDLEAEMRSTFEMLALAADVFEQDPPLAAEFPDGRSAQGILSPRQLAYLVSLTPESARTVRYSELLAATSEVPRLEREALEQVAVHEDFSRRMQSTCSRCGSEPGQPCRTLGGTNPGRETSMHKSRGD